MDDHVCPWWAGYFLASPLRRIMQNPERILQPYVQAGMFAIDVGSAMGFFTLPLARLVGEQGKVVAVDLQDKMIRSLQRRLRKAGLESRVETRICQRSSLEIDDLAGRADFALAFAVLHEMPDISGALGSIARALKPGGLLLLAEPTGHVSDDEFRQTSSVAIGCGLEVTGAPKIRRVHSVVLRKPAN